MKKILAADAAAAGMLFDRYSGLLRVRGRRLVVGSVKRKVGESDLIQETFLAAFEGLDRFEDRGPGSFRRWLEAILDHKAKDEVKRHVGAARRSVRREDSVPAELAGAEPVGSHASPSTLAAVNEERDALRKAIEETTGDDRLVLALVHERGLGFEEAGRVLGRTAEAARKLYGRVVLRLAKQLKGTRRSR